MKRVCKQCGKSFELSDSEIAFYKNKNLNLPKRCKECRQANKQGRPVQEKQDRNVWTQEQDSPGHHDNQVSKWVYALIATSIILLFGLTRISNRFFSPVGNGNTGAEAILQNETADAEAILQNETADAEAILRNEASDAGEAPQNETADAGEVPRNETADAGEVPQNEASDAGEVPQNETADAGETSPDEIARTDEAAFLPDASGDIREEAAAESLQREAGESPEPLQSAADTQKQYTFRNSKLLNEHFEKHGKEMGFSSAEEYQAAASAVVNNANALHKTEKEDGDDVYYLEETNEFVIVSTDGHIRTYFYPEAGIDYYNRQ